MSIEIIGSNDKKIKLIVEDKLNNKIDNIFIQYNLLLEKYNSQINSNIINKQKYEHFISQLIKLFNFNDDLDSFINYLNKINNNNKLNNSIWLFVDRFNLYENLDNALLKILDKLLNKGIIKKHDLLLIDNDYYKNIKYIYKLLKKNDNTKKQYINNIKKELINLDDELLKLNNIIIKQQKINLNIPKNIYDQNFLNNLIKSINNNLYIYKIIKSNILNIDKIINIIIENLYKIYNNL